MNKIVKLIVSFIIGVIGFLSLGLWPYIPGAGMLVSFGLFVAAILAIIAIWKKPRVDGEGDIFKNKDKLSKD